MSVRINRWRAMTAVMTLALCGPGNGMTPNARGAEDEQEQRREVTIAVFDLDVLKGVDADAQAVTDQVMTLLSTLDGVTLVNRDQLKKVADEHRIALSGLVDGESAVRVGRFVSAQYVVVGRASRIGQTFYLVLKLIDVETTVQTTVAAKAPTERGFDAVLERLEEPLEREIRRMQAPLDNDDDRALAELRERAKPLAGKVFLVQVDERHIDRPLRDPAAQMAVVQRLRSLGLETVAPKDPVDGWKRSLLETGRYGEQAIDYLVEGEGVSACAAELQGLTSCRARVELRIVAVPGRAVTASDRGVGAGVDLVEALAAKTALEHAARQAIDEVIAELAELVNEADVANTD
jgi:TolB-like protein